jgi:hypothetical protein
MTCLIHIQQLRWDSITVEGEALFTNGALDNVVKKLGVTQWIGEKDTKMEVTEAVRQQAINSLKCDTRGDTKYLHRLASCPCFSLDCLFQQRV